MRFLVSWEMSPDCRDAANERFVATGALPPAGVTMESRWHCAEGLRGGMLCETDDAAALAAWTNQWTDLLIFEMTPVISDEQLAAVLQG